MNKQQAMNYTRLVTTLDKHGVTHGEVDTLLRCERTLQRWAERECGDGSDWAIERDETTGKPFNVYHGRGESHRYAIADREAGALTRAQAIVDRVNATCQIDWHKLSLYHQGDPRGCTLYVIRPGDIPAGSEVGSCYNRGVGICI